MCKYAEIFYWKNVSSFCSAKATDIFSAKNIRILCIESAKTVNEMTLNKLVKLTTLWTTGPWYKWNWCIILSLIRLVYFSDFQSAGVDTRHSLWKLLLLYLEGTQEVFDSSQGLHLSEHKLLCKLNFLIALMYTLLSSGKRVQSKWVLSIHPSLWKFVCVCVCVFLSIFFFCSTHFYTLPHNSGGVLWFHVDVHVSVPRTSLHPSVCLSVCFSFPDDNLSKH